MRSQDALELRKQLRNQISRQVTHQEMDGIASDRIQGTAERQDIIFAVAVDIRSRNLHCNGINVASEDFSRSQKSRCDRKNSRAGTNIEDDLFGLKPSYERFDRQLRCFVSAG